MPSKDIGKRREAYRKWAKNNKEKRKNYNRILWLARKSNPVKQECSVEDCRQIGERHHPDYSKPEEIIWICRSHHRRLKHSGVCKICGDRVLARGFCNKHYKIERRKVDPEYDRKYHLSHKKKT